MVLFYRGEYEDSYILETDSEGTDPVIEISELFARKATSVALSCKKNAICNWTAQRLSGHWDERTNADRFYYYK